MATALQETNLTTFTATAITDPALVTNTEQIKGLNAAFPVYGWELSAQTDATDLNAYSEFYLKIEFEEAGVAKTVTQKIAQPAASSKVTLAEFYLPDDKTAIVTATAATLFYA